MATNNAWNSNIPVEISKGGTNATSMATTDGTVYYDGTRLVTTATGTAGQVLTSGGAGVAPSYAVGPARVLIKTLTASSSSTLTFTSTEITTTYKIYVIEFYKIVITGTSFQMDWSTDNGSTYLNSNYLSGSNDNSWNSATLNNNNSTTTNPLTRNAVASNISGFINLYGLAVAANPAYCGQLNLFNAYATVYGFNQGTPTVNNIKFSSPTGVMTSGTISLYGITS